MKKFFQSFLIFYLSTCNLTYADSNRSQPIGYAAKNGKATIASISWAALGIGLLLGIGIATATTIYKNK